ncbi:MAG TPA: ATP-binding protein [Candidatus Acidoferrales bacterium]|nr:ATP-binding protein [Candidatus Acidoferrales bacterium]
MSIFSKIFLSFVLAILLSIGATVLLYPPPQPPAPPVAHDLRASTEPLANFTVALIEDGKTDLAKKYWDRSTNMTQARLYLFKGETLLLGDAPQQPVLDFLRSSEDESRHDGIYYIRVPIRSQNGTAYQLIASATRPAHRHRSGAMLLPRLLILFTVTALVCYALSGYLTVPIVILRNAAHRLSSGDLTARAATTRLHRDELGDLVSDFNVMAERIQALVESQNRLVSDISHELRSPLARLNVAVELARSHATAEGAVALERIELEAERLNELVGEILTLARLEAISEPETMASLDLVPLLEEVVNDGSFEAAHRNCTVNMQAPSTCLIRGSRELLRRAMDNVLRNAIMHTPEASTIDVSLTLQAHSDRSRTAVLEVKDSGNGVPESELESIFLPFRRASGAQNRSGHSGLGLAISDRAVRLHGGKIYALNGPEGGLVVRIEFPMVPEADSVRNDLRSVTASTTSTLNPR